MGGRDISVPVLLRKATGKKPHAHGGYRTGEDGRASPRREIQVCKHVNTVSSNFDLNVTRGGTIGDQEVYATDDLVSPGAAVKRWTTASVV